jgi:hypothetical protein
VIPGTLLGLVAFAASLGPGYVYVRVSEKREPRHERTQLLEAAELVVIGTLASSIAALLVLSAAQALDVLNTSRLVDEGPRYILAHPPRGLGSLLVVLVVSYGGAYLAARFVHRGRQATFEPSSMWHQVLRLATESNRAFATVELRDGRVISGWVFAYTALPAEPATTALALHAPIKSKATPSSEPTLIPDHFLVVRADEMVYMSVQYARLNPQQS